MPEEPRKYERFCPGEEHIPISDAVCLGRRRANFHKCPGCPFNDDERGQPSFAAEVMHSAATPSPPPTNLGEENMIEKVFKAYDVRATVPEPLNEDVAWRIGNATAQFLRTSLSGYDRSDPKMNTLIVGRDMRKHSLSLCQAFTEGARAVGTTVVDIGMIDTPQIVFAANHMPSCGGAQTTASHNPANYNGFKISGAKGKPIGAETGLKEIQRIASAISQYESPDKATVRKLDLSKEYREYLLKHLREPRKLKVVVDASNGMAGRWFPIVFDNVPNLEIIPLNFETTGEFVHPPDPLVPANLRQLRDAVAEHGADFGACFDGDADRCMLVDEKANIIRCDLMTALIAQYFLRDNPGATILYDLRSSRIVPDKIKEFGGTPRRERVGHVYMKRAMAENNGIFGGELSGHFYFRDFFFCDNGLMAFIAIVNVLGHNGDATLGELIKPLDVYAASGERNFENEDKDGTIKRIADKYSQGSVDFLDGVSVHFPEWWANVRPSNTEPLLRLNMEATSQQLLDEKLAELTPLLGKPVEH